MLMQQLGWLGQGHPVQQQQQLLVVVQGDPGGLHRQYHLSLPQVATSHPLRLWMKQLQLRPIAFWPGGAPLR
jgi:hypothetical protein